MKNMYLAVLAFCSVLLRLWLARYRGEETIGRGDNLFRRALEEDSLQGASVHAQTTRGFRDVTTAQFIDALDVFPADADPASSDSLAV